jgi:hypothetical protein
VLTLDDVGFHHDDCESNALFFDKRALKLHFSLLIFGVGQHVSMCALISVLVATDYRQVQSLLALDR